MHAKLNISKSIKIINRYNITITVRYTFHKKHHVPHVAVFSTVYETVFPAVVVCAVESEIR